jgi:TatD DNase family protein
VNVSRKGNPPPLPDPLPAPVVDSHAHLDACGFRTPDLVASALDRAEQAGVHRVVTVADDLASARWVAEAVDWDERLYGAVALHPTRTAVFDQETRAELEKLAANPKIVAIGETGLDYYWDYSPRNAQREAFDWHIDLAKRLGKPLMIHDRDAHEDVLKTLDENGAPEKVIFHCFSGDKEMARRCAENGYVMSFAGPVTFRNARELREAARTTPAELLLVETDAPFLAPHPFRGRPNEPYCVAYTLRDLAALRGDDAAELANSVTANAERMFGFTVSPHLVTPSDR